MPIHLKPQLIDWGSDWLLADIARSYGNRLDGPI